MNIDLKQSGDNGGAKWLNYINLYCRAQGFENTLEMGCECKIEYKRVKDYYKVSPL